MEGINVLPATTPEDDTKKQPADAGKISFDYHLVDACQYIEDIHHRKCITVRKSAAFNEGFLSMS